jgi:hypothetical protein
VTNLHNPSGVRIPIDTLRAMAAALARVRGYLLVDEVYLECLFSAKTDSCVHAGPNVLTTNSLTKAYGLDGLRAGWILGPPALAARAGRINDLLTNNSVAPGEQMTLAAFKQPCGHRSAGARAARSEPGDAPAIPGEGTSSGRRVTRRREHCVSPVAAPCERRPARRSTAAPVRDPRRAGPVLRIARLRSDQFRLQAAVLARGLASISRALDDLGA